MSKIKRPRVRRARTRRRSPVDFSYNLYELKENLYTLYHESSKSTVYTDILSDYTVRPGNMSRVLYEPVEHFQLTSDKKFFATYTGVAGTSLNPEVTWSWIAPYLNRLKVSKLPTSNGANLLTNLAELDDTLSLLGKSLKTRPTYGSVKWGWMPLVSDIMACNDAANAVKNSVLSDGRRSSKYRTKDTFVVKTPPLSSPFGKVVHTWDVTVKFSGSIEYDNDICAFYDYLGFHPSPKLLWDIVPLSFALDYILPIGDMLKSLTPDKGWVKSANFFGWRVVTAKVTEKITEINPGYSLLSPLGSVTYVYRDYLNGTMLEQRRIAKPIEAFKKPTWEQAFDLSYLSEAFYNRGKKILSPHVYKKRRN